MAETNICASRIGASLCALLTLAALSATPSQAQNNATGQPAITAADGTDLAANGPNEGSALTAAQGTVMDPEGLPAPFVALAWQWDEIDPLPDGTAPPANHTGWSLISGSGVANMATATFTPTQAQVGKYIRVRLNFRDMTNNIEEILGDAIGTAPVVNVQNPPVGTPYIVTGSIDGGTSNNHFEADAATASTSLAEDNVVATILSTSGTGTGADGGGPVADADGIPTSSDGDDWQHSIQRSMSDSGPWIEAHTADGSVTDDSFAYTITQADADAGWLRGCAFYIDGGMTLEGAPVGSTATMLTGLTMADRQGGTLCSAAVAVSNVNDAPVATDSSISLPANGTHSFAPGDFTFTDADGDDLMSVIVVTVPADGTLTAVIGAMTITLTGGNTISAAGIANMVYTPGPGATMGDNYASFTFRVVDDGTDGGTANTESANAATMTINLAAPTNTPATPGAITAADGADLTTTGPNEDNELTAAAPTDTDGTTTAIFSWQWQQAAPSAADPAMPGTFANIAMATAATFTPLQAQVGQFLRACASFNDDAGNAENDICTTLGFVVVNTDDAPSGAPVIINHSVDNHIGVEPNMPVVTVHEGHPFSRYRVLTTTAGGVVDDDGFPASVDMTLSYQTGNNTDGWSEFGSDNASALPPGTVLADSHVAQGFARVCLFYTDSGGNAEGGDSTTQAMREAGTICSTPIAVTNVNTRPQAAASGASVASNASHTFTAANFMYTDGDEPDDSLASVIIESLPGTGTGVLENGGTPIAAVPTTIAIADIGDLTYNPDAGAAAGDMATFTFNVVDDGGDAHPLATTASIAAIANTVGTTSNAAATFTMTITASPNNPATGAPAITAADGTVLTAAGPNEDNQLTAATTGIMDMQGIADITNTLVWQWRQDTAGDGMFNNITGATTATFTPGQANVGNALQVCARFDDDAGNDETVCASTMAVVNANDAPTGTPGLVVTGGTASTTAITDNHTFYINLTSNSGTLATLADEDGLPPAAATDDYYANEAGARTHDGTSWQTRDAGATGWDEVAWQATNHIFPQADVGKDMRLCLFYTDATGATEGGDSTTEAMRETAATFCSAPTTIGNRNNNPTSQNNTVSVATGDTHTFTAADFPFTDDDSPADGLAAVRIASLPAAGSLTVGGAAATVDQEVQAADIGTMEYAPAPAAAVGDSTTFMFRVRDDGSDPDANTNTLGNPATLTISLAANPDQDPTGIPTLGYAAPITVATEDSPISADTSAIMDGNGIPVAGQPGAITLQWQQDMAGNGVFADIIGQTAATFTPLQANVGNAIQVCARFTDNDGYLEGPLCSAASAAVANVNDAASGTPTITQVACTGNMPPVIDASLTQVAQNACIATSATTQGGTLMDEDGFDENDWQQSIQTSTAATGAAWTEVREYTRDIAAGDNPVIRFQVTQAHVDAGFIRSCAFFTDGGGADEGGDATDAASRASTATLCSATLPVTNVNDAPAGRVAISTPSTGTTALTSLAIHTRYAPATNTGGGTLMDLDGLDGIDDSTALISWQRSTAATGAAWEEVFQINYGNTGRDVTYTPVPADAVAGFLRVCTFYEDGGGNREGGADATPAERQMASGPTCSAAVSVTRPANSAATGNPAIILSAAGAAATLLSGTAQSLYATITSNGGDVMDANVLPQTANDTHADFSVSYQRADAVGGPWTESHFGTNDMGYATDADDHAATHLRVCLFFTDADGYAEGGDATDAASRTTTATLCSAAVPVNGAASGAPTVMAADGADLTTVGPNRDSLLTATSAGITDRGGVPMPFVGDWAWSAGATAGGAFTAIAGATATGAASSTFTPVMAQVGNFLRVCASFTDGGGVSEQVCWTSAAAVVNANTAAAGAPTLSYAGGNTAATEDSAITASTTGITDAEGVTNIAMTLAWQWQQADPSGADPTVPGAFTDIAAATAATFTPLQAQVGRFLQACARFNDDAGNAERVCAATAAVANVNDQAVAGAITAADGTDLAAAGPNEDDALTAADPTDQDGTTGAAFSWQWQQADPSGADPTVPGAFTDIAAATAATFTPLQAQVGRFLQACARFNDDQANAESVCTTLGFVVANTNDAPVATAPGVTLAAGATHTFAAGDFTFTDDDGDALASITIVGLPATGSLVVGGVAVTVPRNVALADIGDIQYTAPDPATVGTAITFAYQITDDGTMPDANTRTTSATATFTFTIAAAAPTAATGAPTVAATDPTQTAYNENVELTASTAGITDPNGIDATTLAWQWQAADAPMTGTPAAGDYAAIATATAATFTPGNDEARRYLRVCVSFTDNGGAAEGPLCSTGVQVANINDAPTGAPGIYLGNSSIGTLGDAVPMAVEGQGAGSDYAVGTTSAGNIVEPDGFPADFLYSWQSGSPARGWLQIATGSNLRVSMDDVHVRAGFLRVCVFYTDLGGTAEGGDSTDATTRTTTATLCSANVPVANVNDAPLAGNHSIDVFSNADAANPRAFTEADFPYTDADGDGLSSVELTTLPALGTLRVNALDAAVGQNVPAADIPNISYYPQAGATTGDAYTSFTFRVRDDGSDPDANTNTLSALAATLSINIVAPGPVAATGAPTIFAATGTAFDEDTELTASIIGVTDLNGINMATISWQWQQAAPNAADPTMPGTFAHIAMATSANLTPLQANVGQFIRVCVRFMDNDGASEGGTADNPTLCSASGQIANTNDPLTGMPEIAVNDMALTGPPQAGSTLLARQGTGPDRIMDEDGLPNPFVADWQWYSSPIAPGGAVPPVYTAIPGAMAIAAPNSSFTPLQGQLGQYLRACASVTAGGPPQTVCRDLANPVVFTNGGATGTIGLSDCNDATGAYITQITEDTSYCLNITNRNMAPGITGLDDPNGLPGDLDDSDGDRFRNNISWQHQAAVGAPWSEVEWTGDGIPADFLNSFDQPHVGGLGRICIFYNDRLGTPEGGDARSAATRAAFASICSAPLAIVNSNDNPVALNTEVFVPVGADLDPYTFRPSDFRFRDQDGDQLVTVIIESIPTITPTVFEGVLSDSGNDLGTLANGGTFDTSMFPQGNHPISAADISGFTYQPPPATPPTTGFTSFRFRVIDDGADNNRSNSATITISLVPPGAARATGQPQVTAATGIAYDDGTELTAATGTVRDVNGIRQDSITWQWQQSNIETGPFVDIAGADSTTFTPRQAHVDQYIRACISFEDGSGDAEGPLCSDPGRIRNINNAPLGGPGLVAVGDNVALSALTEDATAMVVLGGDGSTLADDDGLPTADDDWTYSFQTSSAPTDLLWTELAWEDGSGNETYTPTQALVGQYIRVCVFYTDASRFANGGSFVNADDRQVGSVCSQPLEVQNANDQPMGAPAITYIVGTTAPTEDSLILAARGTIADLDGTAMPLGIAWQWQQGDAAEGPFADIGGQNAAAFTPRQAQVGKFLRVCAGFVDRFGTAERVCSVLVDEATMMAAPVTNINDAPLAQGQTIEITAGGSYAFGLRDFTFTDDDGDALASIAIASTPTAGSLALAGAAVSVGDSITLANLTGGNLVYTPAPAATPTAGYATFTFTITDDGTDPNNSVNTTSAAATITIDLVDNKPATGMPVVAATDAGMTAFDEDVELTAAPGTVADDDGIPNPLPAGVWQWQSAAPLADGTAPAADSADWAAIGAATAAAFTPLQAQVGLHIRACLSFTDNLSTAEGPLCSAPGRIANVNDMAAGTLAASAADGTDLAIAGPTEDIAITADASGITDEDGIPNPLPAGAWQWQSAAPLADGTAPAADSADWADIASANAAEFAPRQAQVGQYIRVRLAFTDEHGTAEGPFYWTAAAAMDNVNDAPQGAIALSGPDAARILEDSRYVAAISSGGGTLMDEDGLPVAPGADGSYYADLSDERAHDGISWQTSAAASGAPWAEIAWQARGRTFAHTDIGIWVRICLFYTDGHGMQEGGDSTDAASRTSTASTCSAPLQVVNANDAPIALNREIFIPIGNPIVPYSLGADDFPFTDEDGDALARITIVSLPATGTLSISGNPAAPGDEVAAANIDTISYNPGPGAAPATGYARFDFRVRDDGSDGTGNRDSTAATITISLVPQGTAPATGAPDVIAATGIAFEEGNELTASLGTVADVNGVDVATLVWQWQQAADVGGPWDDIALAAASTFTPEQPQVGQHLRVCVRFDDNDGNAEGPRCSAPAQVTNINDAALGILAATAADGADLATAAPAEDIEITADITGITDRDGIPNPLPAGSWQWQAAAPLVDGTAPAQDNAAWADIAGANAASFAPDQPQVGQYIRVRLRFDDAHGTTEGPFYWTAAAPVTNSNDAPTGAPGIYLGNSSIGALGDALAMAVEGQGANSDYAVGITSAGNIVEQDGFPADFLYSWQSGSPARGWLQIATGSNLRVAMDDVHVRAGFLRVCVFYTDLQGTDEGGPSATAAERQMGTLCSAAVPVANANDAPVAADHSVDVTVGRTHTFVRDDFPFTDVDGDGMASITIVAAPAAGMGALALAGVAVGDGDSIAVADLNAGDLIYTPDATAADGNSATFTFQVVDDGNQPDANTATRSNTATLTLNIVGNQVATGSPAVAATDAAQTAHNEDVQLTASLGTVADDDDIDMATIAWQWQSATSANGAHTDITAATAATFTPLQAQVGLHIRACLTFDDAVGNSEGPLCSASAPIANVNDPATGPLAASAADGTDLAAAAPGEDIAITAARGMLADEDGAPNPLPPGSWQWQAAAPLADGTAPAPGSADWADIAGADSAEFTPLQAQVGQYVRAQLRFTDDRGGAEGPLYWTAAAPVANVNDAPEGAIAVLGPQPGSILEDNRHIAAISSSGGTLMDEDGLPISRNDDGSYYADLSDERAHDGISWQTSAAATGQPWTEVAWQTRGQTFAGDDIGTWVRICLFYTDNHGMQEGGDSTDATSRALNPGLCSTPAQVTNANDAPVAFGDTLLIPIGTPVVPYTLQEDDFRFTDEDGDALTHIIIVSLPADAAGNPLGTLNISGTPAAAGAEVPVANLSTVTYNPGDGATPTTDYASFRFRVRDDGSHGTGNRDSNEATMRISLVPQGSAPATGKPEVAAAPGTRAYDEDVQLTASLGNVRDVNGIDTSTIVWQWQVSNAERGLYTPISGAAAATFTPDQPQVGLHIRVCISFNDNGGDAEGPLCSDPARIANVNDPALGAPTVAGVADPAADAPAEDAPLTAGLGTATDQDGIPDPLPDAAWTWQTAAPDAMTGAAPAANSTAWADVASGPSYTPDQPQVGLYIRLALSFTDGHNASEGPLYWTAAAPVTNSNDAPGGTIGATLPGGTTLVATAAQGDSLHASLTENGADLSDQDGLPAALVADNTSLQTLSWQRSASARGGRWDEVQWGLATNNHIYTTSADDAGGFIRLCIFYTDSLGADEGGPSNTAAERESASLCSAAIAITNINDAPVARHVAVTTSVGLSYTFGRADFPFDDADGDGLASISIVAPPAAGTLSIGILAANAGDRVSAAQLDNGDLVFDPRVGDPAATPYTSFRFTVTDDGSDPDANTNTTSNQATLTINLVDNRPATGTPAVAAATGTAFDEDNELTASTGTVADEDGIPDPLPPGSWQWQAAAPLADGTAPAAGAAAWVAIGGATAATFTPLQAQVGMHIRACLSFTDAINNAEGPLCSLPAQVANVNDRATGVLAATSADGADLATAAPAEDVEITADISNLADEDGIPNPLPAGAWQWQAAAPLADGTAPAADSADWADIASASAATFTPAQAQVGMHIRATLAFMDNHGTAEGPFRWVSAAAVTNVNDAPAGSIALLGPDITRILEDSRHIINITSNGASLTDQDGLPPAARGDDRYYADLSDERIHDGISWQTSSAASGAPWAEIAWQKSARTFVNTRISSWVRICLFYTDGHGQQEGGDASSPANRAASATLCSTPLQVVNSNDAPVALNNEIFVPTGNPTVPYALSADDFPYADEDGDALARITIVSLPGAGVLSISGTPAAPGDEVPVANIPNITYNPGPGATPASGYASFQFRVRDDGSDGSGGRDSSDATITISLVPQGSAPATGRPTVAATTGTAHEEGNELTADLGTARDVNGINTATLVWQWQQAATAAGQYDPIAGAAASTFTPRQPQAGQYLRVCISFQDNAGNDEGPLCSLPAQVSNINDLASGTPLATTTATNLEVEAPVEDALMTAAIGSVTDAEGLPDPLPAASWTWQTADPDPATGVAPAPDSAAWADARPAAATYTPGQSQVGKYIRLVLRFVDAMGAAEGPLYWVSAAPVVNANDAPQGRISAVLHGGTDAATSVPQGDRLYANISSNGADLTDEDGLPASILNSNANLTTISWQRAASAEADADWAEVQWDPASPRAYEYTTTSDDARGFIRLCIFYTDGQGTAEGGPSNTAAERESGSVCSAAVAVTNINDAPLARDGNISVFATANAASPYRFMPSDFPFDDADADALAGVEITSIPALGLLQLDGQPVAPGQLVSAADLEDLSYFPSAAATVGDGYSRFRFRVRDDGDEPPGTDNISADFAVLTIDLVPPEQVAASGAPTVSVAAGATAHNEDVQLNASTLGIVEPNGINRATIAWQWQAATSTTGAFVPLADATNPAFVPLQAHVGLHIRACVSFTDMFDTPVREGPLCSAAAPIVNVNDAPVTTPITLSIFTTTSATDPYRFADTDFPYTDEDGDALAAVILDNAPALGVMQLGNSAVTTGASIPVADIGELSWYPPPDSSPREGYSTFIFRVSDGAVASIPAVMTISLIPPGPAPASGAPSVSGPYREGEEQSATPTGVRDPNGINPASAGYAWQWQAAAAGQGGAAPAADAAAWADIAGATADLFTPAQAQVGLYLRACLRFVDAAGAREGPLCSAAATPVANTSNAPVIADGRIVQTVEQAPFALAPGHFVFTDADGDALASITVVDSDAGGGLTLGDAATPVADGDSIEVADTGDFVGGPLVIRLQDDVRQWSFRFTLTDDGSDGGQTSSATATFTLRLGEDITGARLGQVSAALSLASVANATNAISGAISSAPALVVNAPSSRLDIAAGGTSLLRLWRAAPGAAPDGTPAPARDQLPSAIATADQASWFLGTNAAWEYDAAYNAADRSAETLASRVRGMGDDLAMQWDGGGENPWRFWLRHQKTGLSGNTAQGSRILSYNGDSTGNYMGIDRQLSGDIRAGIAIGIDSASLDATLDSDSTNDRVERDSVSIYPYINMELGDGNSARIIAGVGSGDISVSSSINSSSATTDLSWNMLAASFSRQIVMDGGMDARLLGGLQRGNTSTDAARFSNGVASMDATDSISGELSFAAQVGYSGPFYRPFVQGAVRKWFGDLSQNPAYDLGAGVDLNMNTMQLRLSLASQINDTEHKRDTMSLDLSFQSPGDSGLSATVGSAWDSRIGGGAWRATIAWDSGPARLALGTTLAPSGIATWNLKARLRW